MKILGADRPWAAKGEPNIRPERHYIRSFQEITVGDVGLVGGKTASLGEMYRALRPRGIGIPNGFAITAEADRAMLDEANAWGPLCEALEGVRIDDASDLARRRQAPFDYPELAAELVRLGIDSISLTPDVIIKTTLNVLALEKQLARS